MHSDEQDTKQTKELHLLTGVDLDHVERVMKGLFISLLLSYYEEKELRFPFIGDFKPIYKGSELKNGKNETKVKIEFNPHPAMKKLIGQVEDEKYTGSYTKNDAFKLLMREIKYGLKDHIE